MNANHRAGRRPHQVATKARAASGIPSQLWTLNEPVAAAAKLGEHSSITGAREDPRT
jgi:hypothetical protein